MLAFLVFFSFLIFQPYLYCSVGFDILNFTLIHQQLKYNFLFIFFKSFLYLSVYSLYPYTYQESFFAFTLFSICLFCDEICYAVFSLSLLGTISVAYVGYFFGFVVVFFLAIRLCYFCVFFVYFLFFLLLYLVKFSEQEFRLGINRYNKIFRKIINCKQNLMLYFLFISSFSPFFLSLSLCISCSILLSCAFFRFFPTFINIDQLLFYHLFAFSHNTS